MAEGHAHLLPGATSRLSLRRVRGEGRGEGRGEEGSRELTDGTLFLSHFLAQSCD